MAESLSKKQIKECEEAFALFDRDADGRVDVEELGGVMRAMGQHPSNSELEDMITSVNVNRLEEETPTVNFSEFLTLLAKMMASKTEKEDHECMLATLSLFDQDDSGHVNADQLRHVMMSLGEQLTQDEVDEMMDMLKDVDLDRSGRIKSEDFLKAMTQS